MKFSVATKGVKKGAAKLNRLAKKQITAVLRKALRNGAKLVQAEARNDIPVRTGATKRTLKVRAGKNNRRKGYIRFKMITQSKTEDAFYYAFVELGTKFIKARNAVKKAGQRSDKRVRKEVADYFRQNIGK